MIASKDGVEMEWVEIKTGEDYERVRGRIVDIYGSIGKPVMARVIKETKMEEPKTAEVIMIIDKSGSMHGMEDDTIGGFNRFLDKQREMNLEITCTLTLFDSETKTVYECLPIGYVKNLDRERYVPGGVTALLDAVGTTVSRVRNRHSSGVRPDKTVVLIITDGAENASREFSKQAVAKLVKKCQKKHNWDFFYLGANVDSFAEAGAMGLARSAAVNYTFTSQGINDAYNLMSNAMQTSLKSMGRTNVDTAWKESSTGDDPNS